MRTDDDAVRAGDQAASADDDLEVVLGAEAAAAEDDRRTRLNATLLGVAVVCLAVAIIAAYFMGRAHEAAGGETTGGFWDRVGAVITDERAPVVDTRAGEDVGNGAVVEAVPTASEADQDRLAAILDSATKMTNAFVNVRYEDVDAYVANVRSLATGAFKVQFDKTVPGLTKLFKRSKTVLKGEVLWAGIVASDDDSATVITATSGTVQNELTDGERQGRNYRLQLDLDLVGDRWLTRNLQFVCLGGGCELS